MNARTILSVLAGVWVLAWCFPACAAESGDVPRSRRGRTRPATEMTVTGKAYRESWTDKEGNARSTICLVAANNERFVLATGGRAEDGQPTPGQLEKFVGKTITVAGKGCNIEENGLVVTYIVSVAQIVVVDPDAMK